MLGLIVSVLFLLQLQTTISIVVKCDYSTDDCICPSIANDDTCEFTMVIERSQTFTRYQVLEDQSIRGTAGRVWYIDEITGELKPHPEPPNSTVCLDPTDVCTDPFTVDGYTFRSVISINGRFPGPNLIVDKDKYIMIHVMNSLTSESISIHWHGMHQRKSNWMDGVEHVTQCGIEPGANFTYIFQATVSGTHWYHSHTGAQRTEGLFGALIIREDATDLSNVVERVGEFKDIPENHTLSFLDWQYDSSIDLFTLIHSSVRFFDHIGPPTINSRTPPITYSSDSAEVGPVSYFSGLINGKGRQRDVDFVQTRLSIFTVESNEVYRFRLVGVQGLYAYRISIDEHKLRVIATDGSFVEPVDVDYIIIHSGERYDFLLKTKNQSLSKDNYVIRAETLEVYEDLHGTPIPRVDTALAILHYNNSRLPKSTDYQNIVNNSIPHNCTTQSHCLALNCPFKIYPSYANIDCLYVNNLTNMFPMTEEEGLPDLYSSKQQQLFLNFGFEGVQSTSAINARNMQNPSVPLAVADSVQLEGMQKNEYCQGLDNSMMCDNHLVDDAIISPECVCTHVREVSGESGAVQLVISTVVPPQTDIELARSPHPVHLHGHYFHVVDIQFGDYNETTGALTAVNQDIDCQGTNLCTTPKWAAGINQNYSYRIANAPLKDTVLVPFGGYAVVYFKPNNPGYWFLHCHIEVHQLEGMAVIISESVDKINSPPSDFPQCGTFDITVDEFKNARDGNSSTSVPAGDGLSIDTEWTGLNIGVLVYAVVASAVSVVLFFICCYLCYRLKKLKQQSAMTSAATVGLNADEAPPTTDNLIYSR